MKIIEPSFEFIGNIDADSILTNLEIAGRVCYKSENKITENSKEEFIKGIINRGHESVLEHEKISVRIVCDRGITHEIVRHRIASYSQESTRYCNYNSEKFGNELTFIKPYFWEEDSEEYKEWLDVMQVVETTYLNMIANGVQPQQARSILPNSLKTEIIVTMDLREWRHFFKLRTAAAAHPQMREITIPMLSEFKNVLPVIFDDIEVNK